MPETTFSVRWPDGRVADCCSPSLVISLVISLVMQPPLPDAAG